MNEKERNNSRLVKVIAAVLQIDQALVGDELSPQTSARWDSFAGLMMLAEVEREFGVSFSTAEILEIKTVGDLKTTIRHYGVEL